MAVNEYAPGTASSGRPVHHSGREYGVVVTGRLAVELDDTVYQLRAGDAISYESATPPVPRISNTGTVKARAIWVNINA
jgi:uncharacterized cupin superfamily protein